MLPPTPISPLFPYTTLFRSRIDKQHGSAPASGYGLPAPYRLENETQQAVNRAVGLLCRHRRIDQQDRKSTRLNSSHLVISYAVFCLKKKKNNKFIHPHHTTY